MKKMKFVKIACAVLTMCLITTCAIGTTLAKYTTGSSASDTARVAKWGVEVSASGTMFGKHYGANSATDDDDKNTIAASVTGSVDTSVADQNIVAPGTKNDTGIQIKLAGTPEVAFKVAATGVAHSEIYLSAGKYGVMVEAYGINPATNFTVEELYTLNTSTGTYTREDEFTADTTYYRLTNYVEVAARYNPIVWRGEVHSSATKGEATGSWAQDYATLAEAVAALTTQINGIGPNDNGTFAANDTINNIYILKWTWAFEGQNDAADTILGDLIAGNRRVVKTTDDGDTYVAPVAYDSATPTDAKDYCLSIVCGIEVTATQVD